MLELMIVVAIVGILSSLALGNYMSFQCRSKQSEAKANLGSIFVNEQAYYAEYETYVTGISEIGWSPAGTTRYAYSIVAGDSTSFVARADSTIIDNDPRVDVWTIDQNKSLNNITNDCAD